MNKAPQNRREPVRSTTADRACWKNTIAACCCRSMTTTLALLLMCATTYAQNFRVPPRQELQRSRSVLQQKQPSTVNTTRAANSPTISTSISPDQLVLNQGQEFEKQGRWGEALSFYQRAVKKHPSNRKIAQRRNIARLHYDLERRYGDSGYVKTLRTTNGSTSLQVYADILAKVQSYYVDKPNWQSLVNHGAASLEIALYDKRFRQQNLKDTTPSKIQNAIRTIRKTLKSFPANNRNDAYVVTSSISRAMNEQLGIPIQSSVYEFVSGAVVALDPYSSYLTGNQYSETMSQIEGNFVGLGVELKTQKTALDIIDVLDGGSAQRAGLIGGDKIISIEGKSVETLGSEVAADMLRGPENSFVILTIERKSGTKHRLRLQRRRVDIQSVDKVEMLDSKNGVAYIRIANFQKTTPRDFDNALWKLHRQGMRSLIVDVRSNPGGLLSASVDIANKFVGKGVIVSTRGRNPLEDYTHNAKLAGTWRVPLIVLIDENSASASEIFAAAVSENRRATVVGSQSYGKGSVQGIFPLNVSGGGIRLTTAKFYSPSGVAISSRGVKPHIEVHTSLKPGDMSGIKRDKDAALKTAMRIAVRNMRPSQ